MLALEGYEMLSIVLILIALFIWGPQKLPEMAKAIGEAKKEFEKVARGVTSPLPTKAQPTGPAPQDPVITAAKSLGIITAGKTKEDLTKEILKRSA